MIYLAIFICIALLCLIEVNQLFFEKKQIDRLYYFVVFVLVLFAGTRFQTGFDYGVYEEIFQTVNLQNYALKTVELGFALLNMGFRSVGFGFNLFLLFMAAMAIILKTSFFKQYAHYIFLGLLNYFTIGFLINDMGQIRFGLAIGISLFAFKDVFLEKYKSAFLKIILAFSFHASAIVSVPLLLLIKYKGLPKKWMLPAIVLLMPFMWFDLRGVFFTVLDYVPIYQLKAKMVFYLYSTEFGSGLGFNASFILRLLIFGVLYFYYEAAIQSHAWYEKVLQLYFYGIVLYLVFNSIAEFATRSSAYFKTLDSLILPFVVTLGKTRLEKNVLTLLIIAYAFWSLYKLIFSAEFGFAFNPYRSFMFNWLYE